MTPQSPQSPCVSLLIPSLPVSPYDSPVSLCLSDYVGLSYLCVFYNYSLTSQNLVIM